MNWWTPWQYPIYSEDFFPLEMLNAALPYMAPAQRAMAARYLYGQRSQDKELLKYIGEGYNQAGPGADSMNGWLRSLSGMSNVNNSNYAGSAVGDWFSTLQNQARQMGPGATRGQQAQWNQDLGQTLANAPNAQMAGIGQAMYTPTLLRPNYGSVPVAANYIEPYNVKGGLVSNPWFAS